MLLPIILLVLFLSVYDRSSVYEKSSKTQHANYMLAAPTSQPQPQIEDKDCSKKKTKEGKPMAQRCVKINVVKKAICKCIPKEQLSRECKGLEGETVFITSLSVASGRGSQKVICAKKERSSKDRNKSKEEVDDYLSGQGTRKEIKKTSIEDGKKTIKVYSESGDLLRTEVIDKDLTKVYDKDGTLIETRSTDPNTGGKNALVTKYDKAGNITRKYVIDEECGLSGHNCHTIFRDVPLDYGNYGGLLTLKMMDGGVGEEDPVVGKVTINGMSYPVKEDQFGQQYVVGASGNLYYKTNRGGAPSTDPEAVVTDSAGKYWVTGRGGEGGEAGISEDDFPTGPAPSTAGARIGAENPTGSGTQRQIGYMQHTSDSCGDNCPSIPAPKPPSPPPPSGATSGSGGRSNPTPPPQRADPANALRGGTGGITTRQSPNQPPTDQTGNGTLSQNFQKPDNLSRSDIFNPTGVNKIFNPARQFFSPFLGYGGNSIAKQFVPPSPSLVPVYLQTNPKKPTHDIVYSTDNLAILPTSTYSSYVEQFASSYAEPTAPSNITFKTDEFGEVQAYGVSKKKLRSILSDIAGREIIAQTESLPTVRTNDAGELLVTQASSTPSSVDWLQNLGPAGGSVSVDTSGYYGYITSPNGRTVDIYAQDDGKFLTLEVGEDGKTQLGLQKDDGDTVFLPTGGLLDSQAQWSDFTEAFVDIAGRVPEQTINRERIPLTPFDIVIRELYGQDALEAGVPFAPDSANYTLGKNGERIPVQVIDTAMQVIKERVGVTKLQQEIVEASEGKIHITTRASSFPIEVGVGLTNVRIMPVAQQMLALARIKGEMKARGHGQIGVALRSAIFNTYDTTARKVAGITAFTIRIDEDGNPIGDTKVTFSFKTLVSEVFATFVSAVDSDTLKNNAITRFLGTLFAYTPVAGKTGNVYRIKTTREELTEPQTVGEATMQIIGKVISAPFKFVGKVLEGLFK